MLRANSSIVDATCSTRQILPSRVAGNMLRSAGGSLLLNENAQALDRAIPSAGDLVQVPTRFLQGVRLKLPDPLAAESPAPRDPGALQRPHVPADAHAGNAAGGQQAPADTGARRCGAGQIGRANV